ncbi:MAG: RluA family pseudouridine synthase [Candidatus Omnitrophota bacterium]|nr:RluA family pseudouridine synthase [Candidatus Omnitrophota bacterium]
MTKKAGYKIIFEDDFILVVDKPAGMLTVPTPKKERYTLSSLLNAYPGHRLDRETSGLILFAKNRQIQQALMDAFKEKRVKKRYIALVQGKLKRKNAVISRPVQDNPYEPGKYAITQYRLLEEREGFSVVEVIPLTGRTNQIRIHFKQIGHPLVGERRFAFAKDFPIKFRRAALHASDLEFRHPLIGKVMSFHSDLPADMRDFLESR